MNKSKTTNIAIHMKTLLKDHKNKNPGFVAARKRRVKVAEEEIEEPG